MVGDAVVFDVENPLKKLDSESEWQLAPLYECFRLYLRNIPYEELEEKLARFKPDQRKLVKLDSDDYLKLLECAVTAPGASPTNLGQPAKSVENSSPTAD